MLSSPRTRSCREHGQVAVLFALLIPVFFGLAAVVLDVGNWYVHKRHLQTQVDAAALAAGPSFVGCFQDPTAANLAIASRALAFAGDTLRPGKYSPTAPEGTTNLQVQEPNDVRIALNSSTYWEDANGLVPGTNGYGLDNTLDSNDPDLLGDPCNEKYLDVKATDDDAPLLWGLLPATPSPKSKAKVEIHDVESLRNMLPWAVPEIDPRRVVALFVDEEPGATPVVFDHQLLEECALPPVPPATSFPWSGWCTSAGEEQVVLDGNHDNTGVVILVSKNADVPALQVSGQLATICGQSPGLVACYSGATQTSGLSFIHAYNGGYNGGLADPQIRQVNLTGSCTAADLSGPYFMLDGGCSVGVSAVIDFGVTGDPTQHPQCARVPGFTWRAGGPDPSRGFWEGTMDVSTLGRNVLNLSGTSGPRNATECGNPGQQPNSWSRSKVAAPYRANGASGPIQYLDLDATYPDLVTVADPNSVEKNDGSPNGAYYNYTVKVGLPKPFSVDNYTEPPLLLRMASPSGSQNQAWDCDSGRNFNEEIETGCKTRYIENFRDDDNNPLTPKQWNNILCTGWNTTNLPPPTTDGPSPYPSDCVITETGDMTGQLRGGLKARFEDPTCVPNNWPDTPEDAADFFGPDGGAYGNDPRYVTLIITDNTAFQGSGNEALPVKYFAGFYVTGWDLANGGGPNSTNGCPDNDPHPVYGTGYQQSLDNGDVWGYFVDIVVFSGGGDPSEELCEFGGDPAACIAVLVE